MGLNHRYTLRNGSGVKRREEGSSGEDSPEAVENREVLLPEGGEITPHPGERGRSALALEAARDLLLDLHPTEVSLGEIVVKGDGEVMEEGEGGFSMAGEPVSFVTMASAVKIAVM